MCLKMVECTQQIQTLSPCMKVKDHCCKGAIKVPAGLSPSQSALTFLKFGATIDFIHPLMLRDKQESPKWEGQFLNSIPQG